MFKNYKKLELTQIIALIAIAFLTVSSSFIINEFDKNYNTPLMNTLFVRGISLIFVIGVGIFLFEEKYNWKQILGILFTISGLILLSQKHD
jgi:drug/metabolite transporter (DMT)-like permease